MNRRMTLSGFVPTKNGLTRNAPGVFESLLTSLREITDEVVVMVDVDTTDDTWAVAKQFADRVVSFTCNMSLQGARVQSFSDCSGDWILHMDDDDTLCRQFTRENMQHLMQQRSVTHYWFPWRALVAASDRFISTYPFIGSHNMRMYRNIASIAMPGESTHDEMAIAGEPAYLGGFYIYAWNFVWHDRAKREEYVRLLNAANPGKPENAPLYLYEDYYYETSPLPQDIDPPKVMAPISPHYEHPGVHIQILQHPKMLTRGQRYWVPVRIINASDAVLLPQSEFIRYGRLELSYRWFLEGGTGEDFLVEDELAMNPFPARILPGHEHDALVRLKTPNYAGSFRLQIDILADRKSWLSGSSISGAFDRVPVTISVESQS
jgi:glycosyltransferase involved in cell wall biosynthesis